jgi:hypothetical protein
MVPENIKPETTADYAAVVAAVQGYIDGIKSGRIEDMKPSFHADAIMYGNYQNNMVGGPFSNFYQFLDAIGPAVDLETRIDVLAITPSTAVARIDMEKDAVGASYTDFHTLVKQDGRWVIVLKVYHPHGD